MMKIMVIEVALKPDRPEHEVTEQIHYAQWRRRRDKQAAKRDGRRDIRRTGFLRSAPPEVEADQRKQRSELVAERQKHKPYGRSGKAEQNSRRNS
jgi:hypothetical protein